MATDLVAFQKAYPTIPAEIAGQIAGMFSDSFTGVSFNRLSLKSFRFTIKGETDEVFPANVLPCVFLAEAGDNHCTWYQDSYDPNKEDVQPNAVWMQNGPVPSIVPPAILQKDKSGRHQYGIARRTVIAIARQNQLNLQTPVVFDVGSMSLFGENLPATQDTGMGYSYSAFRRWCKQMRVYPCQVFVQVVFDHRASVPTVRFVPVTNKDGTPVMLPADLQSQIYEAMQRDDVRALMQVQLIPSAQDSAPVAEAQAAPVAPAPTAVPPVQAAPVAPAPTAVPPVQAAPVVETTKRRRRTTKTETASVVPTAPVGVAPAVPVAPIAPAPAPASAPVQAVPNTPMPQATVATAQQLVTDAAQVDDELNNLLNQVGAL